MADGVNPTYDVAVCRLMTELKELNKPKKPKITFSAIPLENNIFEWHCNFYLFETLHHVILFFPKNYPFKPPSAEFLPRGFVYGGGATKLGKKGTCICLSIFSDFADLHGDWETSGSGWSSDYTIESIMISLISYLYEHNDSPRINYRNKMLVEGFKCEDCGHETNNPYPKMNDISVDVK